MPCENVKVKVKEKINIIIKDEKTGKVKRKIESKG